MLLQGAFQVGLGGKCRFGVFVGSPFGSRGIRQLKVCTGGGKSWVQVVSPHSTVGLRWFQEFWLQKTEA